MQNPRSGDYEICDAGTVISYESNPISFEIDPEKKGSPLTLTFAFSRDEKTENRMEIATNKENAKELIVTLFNVDSAVDGGNVEPMDVGETNGRRILLNFRTRKIGNSYTVDFTIYLKKSHGE